MQYLVVENRGVFGTDLLSIVGASTARGNSDMIGQFGSGYKFSIALLLRNSIDVVQTLGKNVYQFEIDEREADDVRGNTTTIREVVMKQTAGSSRKRRPMGFDVSFGEVDWKDVTMALREFISNAADASMALQGDHKGVRIELVDDPTKFARDGYTRIFIQANSQIRQYIAELKRNFLIFDPKFNVEHSIVPKEMPDRMRVYRKGIVVGTFDDVSLYDYNINDIEVKESRVIDRYSAKYAIGKVLKHAKPEQISPVLEAIVQDRDFFEVKSMDISMLKRHEWDETYNPNLTEKWAKATEMAFRSQVICKTLHEAEIVERKGFDTVIVNEALEQVLKSYGTVKTAHDVLDSFEVAGREKIDLSLELTQKAVSLWKRLEKIGVTKGKTLCPIHGYHDVMNAGSVVLGYFDPKTQSIGISSDCFDSEFQFTQTLLEEYCHFVTGSGDGSRDVQDWVLKVAALLLINQS